MTASVDFSRLIYFFADNLPAPRLILWLFPVALLYSFLSLFTAGICKKALLWKTGYSRKLFHFLIFFSAFGLQLTIGIGGVFILGWAVTILLGLAIYKGDGFVLYEALARETDAPQRTHYILFSYIATFCGGILSNLLFGHFAMLGYAITGLADAVAEPVGTRFGRHHYKVFTFNRQPAYRSLEGSTAVFIATVFVAAIVIRSVFISAFSWPLILLIAFCCTITEALSPRGFDNFFLQMTATLLLYLIR